MKILVSGGAGYIGSHFVKKLDKVKNEILVIDNLSRGHREAVPDNVKFLQIDIQDADALNEALSDFKPEAIVHFAAFAYVGESVEKPELYYYNNVVGSLNLISSAHRNNVKYFVFSSTCSLYGNPDKLPINENEKTDPINPYAQTKFTVEKILNDFCRSAKMKYVALRYFNAAGADPKGEIGESHNPEPHLIPLILQTAIGTRKKISIFGDDYDTEDGTCVRDYIHVNDLADAHLSALNYLEKGNGSNIINLGTGIGYSVKEIINSAKEITGKDFIVEVSSRREGDPAVLVADNSKAKKLLGWSPKFDLDQIIRTAYNWHQNPKF